MSIRLYMDHHVPKAITDGLRSRDVLVITAAEDDHEAASDDDILQRATDLECVVFKLDDDFLVIAADWLQIGRGFAGVVYASQLGITIGKAVDHLETIARVLQPNDMTNRIEFLPY